MDYKHFVISEAAYHKGIKGDIREKGDKVEYLYLNIVRLKLSKGSPTLYFYLFSSKSNSHIKAKQFTRLRQNNHNILLKLYKC